MIMIDVFYLNIVLLRLQLEFCSLFSHVVNRMSLAESELALSETKVNELSALLSVAQEDHSHLSKIHQAELKREREVCLTISKNSNNGNMKPVVKGSNKQAKADSRILASLLSSNV